MNDGIHVQLLWSSTDGRFSVAVDDTRTGQSFSVDVPDNARSRRVAEKCAMTLEGAGRFYGLDLVVYATSRLR